MLPPNHTQHINSLPFHLRATIALAAVNYLVVGRLLQATGKCVGCLQARHVAKIFLASDLVGFLVQGGGGGLMSISDPAMADMGQKIVLFGLAFQIAFFAAFTYVTYHMWSSPRFGLANVAPLRPVFIGLFVTVALLFVRNAFRVAEFASGLDGYASTQEWVFFIFETLPIFCSFLAYSWWHFGWLIPGDIVPTVQEWIKLSSTLPMTSSGAQAAAVVEPEKEAPATTNTVGHAGAPSVDAC